VVGGTDAEAPAGAEVAHEATPTRSFDLDAVPLHRRFHLRVTVLFGALGMALLGALGVSSYRWAREAERSALAVRLEALAVALASGVDPEEIDAILAGGPSREEHHARLVDRFAAVGRDEADVASVYLMVRDEREGWTRFVGDWVRTGTPGAIGQPYDATRAPLLLEAFSGPRVEAEPTTDEWGASVAAFAPVRDRRGEAVAVLGVDVSANRVARLEQQVLESVLYSYGAALLVLAAAGWAVGRRVRRPIQRVLAASAAIVGGRFDARVGLVRRDELGLLSAQFDRMAAGLEERARLRALFGRYVSEEVARRVLASPEASELGGREREVTVLFVNLTRFSVLVEQLAPATVVQLLEQYASTVTELVERHGGCVVEMLGDAILASFGAPEPLPEHPARAVECGLALQASIAELKATWAEQGLIGEDEEDGAFLRPRIGIHTGRVVAGNTGGQTRMKYAILGDTVNLAARLEALNEALGTTMLVSGATHARLPPELAGDARPHGPHAVKGRSSRVDVHAYARRAGDAPRG
jgi:adenylate cyclase